MVPPPPVSAAERDLTPSVLPASVRLAWWGTAWLRGHCGPDDLIDAVVDVDATHLVTLADAPEPLMTALGRLRSAGADAVGAAVPVEGDLVGLGGPPELNDAALDAGEAALVLDAASFPLQALVPSRVGAAVTWHALPAARRQLPDVGEADRTLRETLLAAASDLAAMDVAKWRPEVADRLMNLRHRPHLPAPAGVPARCVDLAARSLQALDIVELALEDDGGALSASEISSRRSALVPLGRAGRRGLVASASPEVWPPS